MQALYIALIMLLKDKMINYFLIIGLLKGLADGFYHYPKSILNSEKISNENRQKFSGIVNTINNISSIVIPLFLGFLLTFISYTDLGKIFFMLFIVMFLVSFAIDDYEHYDKKFEMKKFLKLVKSNKNIKNSLLVPVLSGITYSSGVMGLIVTLDKINVFKTNLNLGFVDSLVAIISLFICILYSTKLKSNYFKLCLQISGIFAFLGLSIFALIPNGGTLIMYLVIRYSFIQIINLISDNVTVNLSNCSEIKNDFKSEYYCMRDILFAISRVFGYLILLVVAIIYGINYINYILIVCGVFLIIEAFLVGNLSKMKN